MKSRRGDVIAGVLPYIFLTLTLTECKNAELFANLHKNAGMGNIGPETAMRLPDAVKTKLIKDDVFCRANKAYS